MADYTDLDPTLLRASVSDGTNLKPSITTSGYAGGTPAAASDLKRSICYADGTLKESIADSVGVKASWLLAGSDRPPGDATTFITTWETTAPSESITVPTTGAGYDCTVDWGDGNSDSYSGTAPTISHTYASAGTHTVTISGTFPRIYFNNTGDKAKIRTVEQFGEVGMTSLLSAFFGCTGLTQIKGALPVGVTTVQAMCRSAGALNTIDANLFSQCGSTLTTLYECFLNTNINSVPSGLLGGLTSVTNCYRFLYGCPITSIPSGFCDDLTACTNFAEMFFQTDIVAIPSGLLDNCTAGGASFSSMFSGCSSLTAIPSGLLDNCNPVSLTNMLRGSGVTAVNFGTWNWANVTAAVGFLEGLTINTADYNTSMDGIYQQSSTGGGGGVQSGVAFHGGNSVDTTGPPDGIAAVASLTTNDSWTITDGT